MPSFNSILPFIIVAILIITFVILYLQRQKHQELLQYQAEKRNGYIESSSFLRPIRLVLPLGDHALHIYTVPGGKNRPSKTIAELTGSTNPFPQIKISRNTLFQKALETFGKERFQSGDEEFDKTFVINTDDEGVARRILTFEIPKNLMEMASKSPSLEVGPQNFKLVILRALRDTEGYDLFIDTALTILNKLK